jgi:hypothetical protein
MAMVPHERSLVEKLQGKPFALLGVNADNSKEECKKVIADNKINWRSWYDGSNGPIAKQWKIKYFPTIYVLDHKGVIRHKDIRDAEMEKAVEALIKEAEADAKK